MQIVEHSLVASYDICQLLLETSGNVAPRTHIKSHEVRLVWSTFAAWRRHMRCRSLAMALAIELALRGRRSPRIRAFPIGRATRSRGRKSPLPPCGQDHPSTTSGTFGRKTPR